ncbi:MAG: zinc ribbon domain-containing protein [Clostridia bacterium]|nr:zinc ribbon domain-containing protein [Clostridia bacterium]
MILTSLLALIVFGVITFFKVSAFISANKFINDVAFIDAAMNPFEGAEAIRTYNTAKGEMITILIIDILLVLLIAFCFYVKYSIIPKLKRLKEAAKANKKVKVSTENLKQRAQEAASQNMKFCLHCGEKIDATAVFCDNCGKRQDEPQAQENEN